MAVNLQCDTTMDICVYTDNFFTMNKSDDGSNDNNLSIRTTVRGRYIHEREIHEKFAIRKP